MNAPITVTINVNNDTNKGWLLYLLGQDKPDVNEDEQGAAGWEMARMTGSAIDLIRRVFTHQTEEDPAFAVNVTVNDQNVVVVERKAKPA